ncbi:hypothetical protein [Flavobacterium sp. 22076]|uniref:hypothetical protein n=1 Tax=unclassified Flavobacterium TaxID=196869 RepID=UPI003F849B54
MSLIPAQFVIQTTLKVGVIYKFIAPELIGTAIPHYFIVVAIDNEDNYMVLCTTQLDAKLMHIAHKRYHSDTLAFIAPTEKNGLTEKTYVNCNDYYTITRTELIRKIETSSFEIKGNLTKEEYDKIRFSIDLSHVNDIPTFMLKYPEDL